MPEALIHPALASLEVRVDSLINLPGNPRIGNVEAVRRSFEQFGQRKPIVVRTSDRAVLAGNHQLRAARELGWETIAAVFVEDDEATAAAFAAADNRTSDLGTYDDDLLAALLSTVVDAGDAALLAATGYSDADLAALLTIDEQPAETFTQPDELPELAAYAPVTKPGDLWLLGPHRILCGDSTDPAAVAYVTDGEQVTMIHADPPYGMGKESEGIQNDNLYRDKLDDFQVAWLNAWGPALTENGSVYIWGTAPDLFRLWYARLADDPANVFRNEIVWNKTIGMGMRSGTHHSYPTATERCLFYMRGQQFLGNQNTADFWEGYEPLRAHIAAQVEQAGWTAGDVNRITGTHMFGHWATRSQFMPISEKHYGILQQAAAGNAFVATYSELFGELFPELRTGGNAYRRDLSQQLREGRTTFDNTHDAMTDVWTYDRVQGDERYGHATPKPVSIVTRAIKTSSAPEDLIGVPFAGTCPEIIAGWAESRRIAAIELTPEYVDLIARRYTAHTGDTNLQLIRNGKPIPFDLHQPAVIQQPNGGEPHEQSNA